MRFVASTALATSLLVSVLTGPAGAVSLLADYRGFDYEPSKAGGPNFGDVGNTYEVLSTCPELGAPLVFNLGTFEYTVVISGLTSVSKLPLGTYDVINYSGGTVKIYEDNVTVATYGTNPVNPTAPAWFVDGANILIGTLSNFQMIYDNATRTGNFDGTLTFNGGTQIGNFPANQRSGWTFSGVTANSPITPAGYAHQVDGEIFLDNPVPVKAATWGGLKALYAH